MKQRSESQKARDERRETATGVAQRLHPGALEIICSWFGMDLYLDVKDKDGGWHRYAHHTDDPGAAVVLGSV